jgi:outer membrane protein assembly complex protein YaeT
MRPAAIRRIVSRGMLTGMLMAACAPAAGCREEGSGIEVKDLSFTGVSAVSTGAIKSILATTESQRLPWGEKFFFDRSQFEADLKRIVAFYRDRGYPDARIRSFDVQLSQDQTSVRISVEIEEGEPIRVERIVLQGFEPIPEDHRRALDGQLPLRAGQPLDRSLLQASREVGLDEFRDHGYPSPRVDVTEEPGSAERLRVVTFAAQPGRVAYVGPIEITGVSSVDPRVVRRQLTFRSGELFQESRLRESQRKLYSLELFNFVNVEAVRGGAGDTAVQGAEADRIPARVTLTEGKHRKVNFGAGYGSEERARGEIDWRHVNFFGGARTAGVVARYSALDRGVRLNFKQPYVFNPRYTFNMSGQSWFSNEPAYELTTIGGRATLTRDFGGYRARVLGSPRTTTVALTYANEWEDYTISDEALADPSFRDDLIALGLNPETGGDTGQLSALSLDGVRNTTGSLIDSRSGYLANLHVEQAGAWLGGDFNYFEVSGEGRYYQSLGSRAVVAVRARAGSIDSSNPDTLVPFFKRYFLGGATNLRGWGRYEVAPLTDEGNPIGGTSFFNFSTELRVPLVGKLGGVLFVDGGNVWSNAWDFNFNDLRYDIGPGLRYNTPIGPFRLDAGFQLNPVPGLLVNGEEQTRRFRIHFSIGQAF